MPRIALALALALCPGAALAGVVASDGAVEVVTPPPSAVSGAYESSTAARVWEEAQDVLLSAPLTVDIDRPGTYTSGTPYSVGTLPAGTSVRVVYLHVDPRFSNQVVLSGSVTFERPILGVQVTGTSLAASDGFNGGVTEFDPTPSVRRFDTGTTDVVRIDPADPATLVFTAEVSSGLDQLRVFTEGGPVVEVGGTCPGQLDITVGGVTPGGEVAFLTGRAAGASIVPAGPCAGAMIDLTDAALRERRFADGDGTITFQPAAGAAVCGAWGQIVDITTCEVSAVVALP